MDYLLIDPTHLLPYRHAPFLPSTREKECVGLFALLWPFSYRPTFEMQRIGATDWRAMGEPVRHRAVRMDGSKKARVCTMRISQVFAASLLAFVLLVTLSAGAASLPVTSYSMYNGAHSSFDYRDFTYVSCNSVCDVTGAALSGGTGKLTDGVSPSLSWYQYGESTPWVGWDYTQLNGLNPTVRFFFGSTVTISSVTVWVDNSIAAGGVYMPSGVPISAI